MGRDIAGALVLMMQTLKDRGVQRGNRVTVEAADLCGPTPFLVLPRFKKVD